MSDHSPEKMKLGFTREDRNTVAIWTLGNGLWLGTLLWLIFGLWLGLAGFLTCWIVATFFSWFVAIWRVSRGIVLRTKIELNEEEIETNDDELDPELKNKLDEVFAEMAEEEETIDDPYDELDPELQYYEAIEKHIETIGHKETVLTVQGTDQEFCEASLKLYKAGYEHDENFKFIACAVAEAAHDHKKNPELAISFLESWRERLIDK